MYNEFIQLIENVRNSYGDDVMLRVSNNELRTHILMSIICSILGIIFGYSFNRFSKAASPKPRRWYLSFNRLLYYIEYKVNDLKSNPPNWLEPETIRLFYE